MPVIDGQPQKLTLQPEESCKDCAARCAAEVSRSGRVLVSAESARADELMYELIERGGYPVSARRISAAARSGGQKKLLSDAGITRKYLVFEPENNFPFAETIQAPFIGMIRLPQSGAAGKKTELYERSGKMDINSEKIEQIVKEVLQGMSGQPSGGAASAPKAAGTIPKTSRVAMLTALEHYEIKEYPIPEVGDDDILVKVEGCGVCGTDAHEFKRDPFGLIPLVLGHEGTGEIVKMGKNVKQDSAGKPLAIGDKVVTCMIFKDNPE